MSDATRVRSIGSRSNPDLRRWRRLAEDPGAYRRAGEVWIEGDHLCAAYASSAGTGSWEAVISETGWAVPALRQLAERAGRVAIVADASMRQLSTLESPPSICAVVPWTGAGSLDPTAAGVVLDRVQDPGNVGNILRSAAAFGFRQVVAIKGTVGLWSPKVLRAAMGAHFGALRLVESLDAATLADWTVPLLATSSHAGTSIDRAALPWPCAWVLGHEGQGVAPSLAVRCASTLRIPQPGGEESLNVAAAAAVCFYESARQRRAACARPFSDGTTDVGASG